MIKTRREIVDEFNHEARNIGYDNVTNQNEEWISLKEVWKLLSDIHQNSLGNEEVTKIILEFGK